MGRQSVQRVRWVVERTVLCLLRLKRLVLRYDRTQFNLRPLLTVTSVLINLRRLVQKSSATRSYCEANSNHE